MAAIIVTADGRSIGSGNRHPAVRSLSAPVARSRRSFPSRALSLPITRCEDSRIIFAVSLNEEEADLAPLDELIDGVLGAPDVTERTSIRFMTTRMREHRVFDRVPDIADRVEQMPHAADHLARLFRDSGSWADQQETYVAYAKRWRTRLPWSVAQLGTMFPSTGVVAPALREFFAEVLQAGGAPLPLLTVAAQRLAAWDPDNARALIREAAENESHPMARRSLGLAALHAGEVTNVVRKLLQQHEENSLVLAMLEDVRYAKRAVPVTADFG